MQIDNNYKQLACAIIKSAIKYNDYRFFNTKLGEAVICLSGIKKEFIIKKMNQRG